MITLVLMRRYHIAGCNGRLFHEGKLLCETIELPWRNNRKRISCIPEGRYRLQKRGHHKHGSQLHIANVPNREAILIHPANFALSELQGCIAPVSKCTGPGKGNYSKIAMTRLGNVVYPALSAGEEVFLHIISES